MKSSKILPLLIAISLLGAGCQLAQRTNFGQSATLRVGGSQQYQDGLSVTLKQINDSRCANGVVCIWAGELSPVLELSGGDIGSTAQEVIMGTTTAKQKMLGNYTLNLEDATASEIKLTINKK